MWQPSAWSPNSERLAYMNLDDYRPMLLDPASGISSPFSEGTDGVGAAEYSTKRKLVLLQNWMQLVEGAGTGASTGE